MVSVAQRSKVYRPITTQNGVEGKECAVCGEWKPRAEYTAGHYDGLDHRCKPCQARLRAERTATKFESEIPPERAPVLAQPRAVVLDGVSFQVGVHGDAEYVPLGALVGFSRYTTDEALVRAVKSDELLGAVTTILQVLNPRDKKTYQVWCLPWSHFNAFCFKFGGPETLPQQQRAQQVIEAAFGRTAQSNREATRRIDIGKVSRGVIGPDDLLRHRERITALYEAEDEAVQARDAALADREHARAEYDAAADLERQAQERKEAARTLERTAQQRVDEAERKRASLKAELERSLGNDVQYIYLFGQRDQLDQMWFEGKFGQTCNLSAKRKYLRAGNIHGDFLWRCPCDDGEACEEPLRAYMARHGRVIGNDHFSVDGPTMRELLPRLQSLEYVEAAQFERFLNMERAA